MLDEAVWTRREGAHAERVDAFCAPHLARRRTGENHPVWDFLFTYYSLRPRQLRRWHPGFGVTLGGPAARRYLGRSGYGAVPGGVAVTAGHLRGRLETVRFVAGLLHATANRPPRLNCFGLHEWAMVYRAPEVRHDAVPLRLGAAGTDAVVDSMPLRCSHFDAYRFFTEPAAARNAEPLSRDRQADTEQPGCLHAAMDLYKWSYKLGPLVPAESTFDCLELAADARVLDMRASPYDLREHGFDPIPVETPAGRAEYVRIQQDIAARARPLRATLAARCDALLAAAEAGHELGHDPVADEGFGLITRG
ncbi:3-methyladenine DNA glycosylase [Mycolicibacterium sp. S2-37]|uniref:3-methyladenine DNA glycosylase n=1 Tax=Mycolicibacterium sp. S2-37 TaxID=2810297 RepID=UPI001A9462B8|nr:3-methyladenine DNA glycosylase [Mycolicibacterium sp. S2-37]MBO0675982.1 3-methyladenine DNA glycosylase [Mycolicibacterium sp. S2-37]